MSPAEFERLAVLVVGTVVDWKAAIAERLQVPVEDVQRWMREAQIPETIEARMAELIHANDPAAPWPRDEWILGEAITADGRKREYIVHLEPPRFAARVVMMIDDGEPDPDEEPVDLEGMCFQVDPETWITEIAWLDKPPSLAEISKVMEAASRAIDLQNERDGLY